MQYGYLKIFFQNENQEANPLEYLDAQITISEQPTGSVQIKNEDNLEIKSEPDVNYDQQTIVEGENEQDHENEEDDEEEEDDKPISELISYSRSTNENSNNSGIEEMEKGEIPKMDTTENMNGKNY